MLRLPAADEELENGAEAGRAIPFRVDRRRGTKQRSIYPMSYYTIRGDTPRGITVLFVVNHV
jgi:hypothetical protein